MDATNRGFDFYQDKKPDSGTCKRIGVNPIYPIPIAQHV